MKKKKTKVKDEKNLEDVLDKPEKKDIIENEKVILEREMAKKKVPKEVSQEILKKIFKNLILAIVVMIYFISFNILYTQLELEQMEVITKIVAGVFLLTSIIILEIAYKRESGTLTLTSIELLVLAIHALFIHHIITIYHFAFRTYLLTSSYIFAIYYVLKSISIYTRARIKYLKSFSDISEIVKDEPVKKEAKKRNEESVVDTKEGNIEEKKETKKRKSKKKENEIETKQEETENHTEEVIEEVKKQQKPKSKRGRKKKKR